MAWRRCLMSRYKQVRRTTAAIVSNLLLQAVELIQCPQSYTVLLAVLGRLFKFLSHSNWAVTRPWVGRKSNYVSITGKARGIFFRVSRPLVGFTQALLNRRWSSQGLKLTSQLHQVPRYWMSWTMDPLRMLSCSTAELYCGLFARTYNLKCIVVVVDALRNLPTLLNTFLREKTTGSQLVNSQITQILCNPALSRLHPVHTLPPPPPIHTHSKNN
jgi:hypothetical protein